MKLYLLTLIAVLVSSDVASWRIRSGTRVSSRDVFSFIALIQMGPRRCAGSLIGPSTVLTAAHCLCKPDPVNKVVFKALSDNDLSGLVYRPQSTFYVSTYQASCLAQKSGKQSTGIVGGHDMGIVLLEKPVNVDSESVKPISVGLQGSRPAPGTTALILGYGRDENDRDHPHGGILKFGYGSVKTCPSGRRHNPICVAPGPENQVAQKGDSGGPLLLSLYGPIVGVVSGTRSSRKSKNFVIEYASTEENAEFLGQYI